MTEILRSQESRTGHDKPITTFGMVMTYVRGTVAEFFHELKEGFTQPVVASISVDASPAPLEQRDPVESSGPDQPIPHYIGPRCSKF